MTTAPAPHALAPFHPVVADWFARAFEGPTPPQVQGWPPIAAGDHTLTGAVLFADGHDPEVSATVAFTAQ